VEAAQDLDQYLLVKESRVPGGVKPGTEKTILWRNPLTRERTPTSIVYLHGFSASRGETSPLMEMLAERLGANLFYTRLKAHGLFTSEGFATVEPQDWIDDAREALAIGRRIGERVIVVGMSTGAPLAIELALENVDKTDLAALILLSPNFRPIDARSTYLVHPMGPWLARLLIGEERSWVPSNEEHAYFWTWHYPSRAIVSMMELVNYASTMDLSQVKLPVLVMYTHNDGVVSVPLITERFAQIGSAKKKLIDLSAASRHELAGRILLPEAIQPALSELLEFLESLN
jgi:alpha-beta hydrolase superfamily lysophospholipase